MTAQTLAQQEDAGAEWRRFWIVAAAITAARVVTLLATPLELGPDEAQYWFWSRDLDIGYFSKPPLIAWAIAATTSLFGAADWAVRLSAPLFHLGAAAFLFLTARALFGPRAAFWTGVAWLVMPGVILSSFIIATDAPMLFFWSAALYFLTRIAFTDAPGARDFAALGAAIGLGLLSKYAMIYFPIAMAAMLFVAPLRARLMRPALLLTAALALAIFAPNTIWNAQHDFHTLSHTAANAQWTEDLFKPLGLVEFFLGQFAVFGVIAFAALLWAAFRILRRRAEPQTLMLLILAATPLLIVCAQAFLSRAHANWAAAAYPAAAVLVTGLLLEARPALIRLNAGLHAAVFALFTAGALAPGLADRIGAGEVADALRGWEAQTAAIMAYAPGYDAVVVDDRYLIAQMLYHQRDSAVPIVSLSPNPTIDHHYEAFVAFDPARMKRVLFVTTRDDDAHVNYRFREIRRLGAVAHAGGRARRYTLYDIAGYTGPDAAR